MAESSVNINNPKSEISVADLFDKFKLLVNYLKTKWIIIVLASLIGLVGGICYSLFKKPTYTALCTFVLEGPRGNGASQYSGLASLVGINLTGGASGIFEGENILELYKSRTMIKQALLTRCNFNGHNELLIDRLIDDYNLRDKDDSPTGSLSKVDFSGDPLKFNRTQDSIINALTEFINKKILNVTKPDKRLSIINVEVASTDELFSKYFNDKIVQNVNDFYIKTKTKKALQNVQTLQHQSDSVKAILNASLRGVASANDADPNANPLISALRVPSQKRQVDVQASTAIYSEIVKNLELGKISLREEVPLIQTIDGPVLPLKKNKVGLIKGAVLGCFLFGALTVLWLSVRKISHKLLKH